MSQTPKSRLADQLTRHFGVQHAREVAGSIITDPQRLVDDLVEAGVLKARRQDVLDIDWYTVIPPHVHEWIAPVGTTVTKDGVPITCTTCREERIVGSNRLPIEIPS